ncbi:Hypothetical predicted protein [Mytilus galloprovincialis]|uniref:Uncharacterized protein n=1 Tax=Mytilus galloprovincialis TaxID=29158 RepID=A0A8B6BKH1_MYTGA|nr:Hypothetical predicted protein [Mytilus galloprovincialis]
MARRMTPYMTDNNYVDTSVQKGGVPGFSGCIEHTSIVSQLIQEAKVNKKDLTVDATSLLYRGNRHGETIKYSLEKNYQDQVCEGGETRSSEK